MKNYRCAIFGQNTICFKWGFDEDDEYCIAMKQELLQKIMDLPAGCNTVLYGL